MGMIHGLCVLVGLCASDKAPALRSIPDIVINASSICRDNPEDAGPALRSLFKFASELQQTIPPNTLAAAYGYQGAEVEVRVDDKSVCNIAGDLSLWDAVTYNFTSASIVINGSIIVPAQSRYVMNGGTIDWADHDR